MRESEEEDARARGRHGTYRVAIDEARDRMYWAKVGGWVCWLIIILAWIFLIVVDVVGTVAPGYEGIEEADSALYLYDTYGGPIRIAIIAVVIAAFWAAVFPLRKVYEREKKFLQSHNESTSLNTGGAALVLSAIGIVVSVFMFLSGG